MKLNKILLSLFAIASLGLASCEEDNASSGAVGADHVSFMKLPAAVVVPENETIEVEAKVYASQSKSSDRVIELEVVTEAINSAAVITTANPQHFSVPASVTIPAGEKVGTFKVNITGIGLGVEGKKIVVKMKPQDGIEVPSSYLGAFGADTYEIISDRLVITAKEGCFKNSFQVQISTDRYGDETTWELYDAAGNILGQGGPYATQSASGAFPQTPVNFCLDNGNYTFIIYDEYEDGMDSGYGSGFYRLVKIVDGQEIEIAKNGVFGAFDEVIFSLP